MISLVTSFYNWYDRFLEQWLDAVLSAEELPDEIVLAVSGNDYDKKAIEKAKERLTGVVPFSIVFCEHRGMGHARNKAVEAASSDWVMHLNVDDVLTEQTIKELKKAISDDVDIVVGNMEWVGHARSNGVRKYNLTIADFMNGRTNDHAAYRKALWEKSKYIEYSGDVDVAFWIGLAHLEARIKYIDVLLSKHFFRPDTVFGRYTKEDLREIKRMAEIWKTEGVHSARFNHPDYQIKGDADFSHRTNKNNPELSIIMAFRSDGGIRDKHLKWAVEHFRKMFPDAEIIVEQDSSNDSGWRTFNKSRLLNKGVARSHGRVLFITDIDMVFVKNRILKAVEKADNYSILFPLNDILYIPADMTKKILSSENTESFPRIPLSLFPIPHKNRANLQAGGSYVITRANYDAVGGHDERFVGWGSEDSAFIKAAATIIEKPFLRMHGQAYHLWHPTDKRRFKRRDTSIKPSLMKEYTEAMKDRDKMLAIVQEHLRVREADNK